MARRIQGATRARRARTARLRARTPRDAIPVPAARLVEAAHLALVGELAGALAHELGGPAGALALLVGELDEALAGRAPFEDLGPIVRDVGTCSERLSALVRLVRRVARRDSWASSVDLAPIVADATAIARIRAKGSSIEFSVSAESAHVSGAPGRLEALALALLIQAVDACRIAPAPSARRHRVGVSLFGEASFAVLRISHDAPASLDGAEAFDPARALEDGAGGAGEEWPGLFLFMARQIALEAGGSLELVRGPGEGATLEARLPLAIPTSPGAPAPRRSP